MNKTKEFLLEMAKLPAGNKPPFFNMVGDTFHGEFILLNYVARVSAPNAENWRINIEGKTFSSHNFKSTLTLVVEYLIKIREEEIQLLSEINTKIWFKEKEKKDGRNSCEIDRKNARNGSGNLGDFPPAGLE